MADVDGAGRNDQRLPVPLEQLPRAAVEDVAAGLRDTDHRRDGHDPAVQIVGTALAGPLGAGTGLGRGTGGQVDQVSADQVGAGQRVLDRGVVQQADDDQGVRGDRGGSAVGGLRALRGERGGSGRGAVPDGERVAGGKPGTGQRGAHRTEAQQRDGVLLNGVLCHTD
ncbi:hypothetical protein M2157_009009 [Streptomyces sp. SAI-127]|nr:hypothetical protein [Streptomyces sp. SAI-127]